MNQEADFTVEVRDRDFSRLGQIAPEFTDIKFVDAHNGVGAWEMRLPAEHPLLSAAKDKGAGIIVTEHWMEDAVHKYRVFSGRMRTAVLSQNAADPAGTWIISGVDDNITAAATRVYPDPASGPTTQTAGYWEQTGPGETVMKLAVQLNAGATAIPARRYPWLSIAAGSARGSAVKCSSRFDVLGDLLSSLGASANLGWEFRQSGNGVVFDVYVPADKRGEVRLDIRNGGLESNELGFSAPSASEVLVLGQGGAAARTVVQVTSPEATAEAVAWGLRWENVKDQRNTDDLTELTQAGTEILAELGSTVNSLKVVPSDAPGMRLGRDWYRGDRITVVIDGQETSAVVTQVATSITSVGVIRQATVGDPAGFSFDAKVASKLKDQEQRIGAVERLIGQGVSWQDVSVGAYGRGSTGARNAQFGVPTTPAARLALANLNATWFNTDFGWEEAYYEVTATPGLTAKGLMPGTAPGWYPTGAGPFCSMEPTASLSVAVGNYIGGWNGNVKRSGGASWFTPASPGMRVLQPGRYEMSWWTLQQTGTGQADYHTRLINEAGSLVDWMTHVPAMPLSGTTYTRVEVRVDALEIRAGQQLRALLQSGNLILHNVSPGGAGTGMRGQMTVRYQGPLLVTD